MNEPRGERGYHWHKAPDGTYVAKERECFKQDGVTPKRIFDAWEEAERIAASMSVQDPNKRGARYHAYRCTSGHIHVGRKLV